MERPGYTSADRALFVFPPTQVVDPAGNSTQTANRADKASTNSLETLEGRRLLSSVLLESGTLTIYGNKSSSNTLGVWAKNSSFVAVHNGQTRTVNASSVKKIVIHGSSKDDNIWITNDVKRPSVIKGYDGDDVLSGGSGQDWLYGGDDNDTLYGNGGDDYLFGDDDNDKLWGGKGNNYYWGGPGTDVTNGAGQGPSNPAGNNGNAASPKAKISAQRTTVMAGHAIHVHATNSSLGVGNPQTALYEWNFGDKGSPYNYLQGFNAAHQYKKSGTYKITLTVTNQAGKRSSTTLTVKVTADTRRHIYVSKSGSDSNPGTQSRPIKSWAKAATLLESNTEILFRRGDTFDAGVNFDIKRDNIVVGAYGSGSNPVIRWTADVSGYPTIISPRGDNIAIENLTFTSNTSNPPQAIRASGNNVTVRGNTFKTLGYAVNGNAKPDGLLVQGNSAPDIGGIESYFIWGEGTDHVYLGNYVANSRQEHVIRVSGADRVLVWQNKLTNSVGQVSGDNTPKGALTLHRGSYYWVGRNELNKGPVAIGPLGNGDGMSDKGGRFRYGVFDGNTFNTKVAIDHGAERIMFRNNVINSGDSAILVEGYNSSYGRTTNDVTIVNNTVINGSSTGRFIQVEKGAASLTLANNLYVAPRLQTGQTQTASVYIEDSGLSSFKFIGNNVWAAANTLKYAEGGQNYVWPDWSNASGYKSPGEWNKMGVVSNDYFSDVSISGYTPKSGTTATSAGRYFEGVFQDRYGKRRPGGSTWTAGAVQR